MTATKFLWGDDSIFIYWQWNDIKTKQNKKKPSSAVLLETVKNVSA